MTNVPGSGALLRRYVMQIAQEGEPEGGGGGWENGVEGVCGGEGVVSRYDGGSDHGDEGGGGDGAEGGTGAGEGARGGGLTGGSAHGLWGQIVNLKVWGESLSDGLLLSFFRCWGDWVSFDSI